MRDKLARLIAQLGQLERQDYCSEMSDNQYYNSGRKEAMRNKIRCVKAEIEELEQLKRS